MNWYKESREKSPIQILSYNQTYNELRVSFGGAKAYTYYNVNPFVYEQLTTAIRYNNYSQVSKLLRNLASTNNKQII